jgi:hypothetical protein
LSLTQCKVCDYPNKYYLLPNSTCAFCDSTSNLFINLTDPTYPCTSCLPTNCLQCSSLTQCQKCNSPYVLNISASNPSAQCISCPIANCLTCINITHCQQCDYVNSFGINSNSTCDYCNNSLSYPMQSFVNVSSFMCQLCTINGCI